MCSVSISIVIVAIRLILKTVLSTTENAGRANGIVRFEQSPRRVLCTYRARGRGRRVENKAASDSYVINALLFLSCGARYRGHSRRVSDSTISLRIGFFVRSFDGLTTSEETKKEKKNTARTVYAERWVRRHSATNTSHRHYDWSLLLFITMTPRGPSGKPQNTYRRRDVGRVRRQ